MTQASLYDETKVSIILCVAWFSAQVVVLLFGLQVLEITWAVVITLLLLLVFMNVFSLRVAVSRSDLIVTYGLGLLSRTYPLEYVQSIDIVPNSYWTWLYDPRLEHVLRVSMRDGSRVIVGIGDAKRLAELVHPQRR